MFWRKWIDDIRKSTRNMSKSDRAEYIAEYYWYHILLTFLGIVLFVLVIYHVTAGRRTVSFACVIVNEAVDHERDSDLAEEFAEALGLDVKKVRVDSDYRISYPGHVEEENNESDYEKFFFGWSQGELDVVILPESFFAYCQGLGGSFRTLTEDGALTLPLSETSLSESIRDNAEDPMVIMFPSDGTHEEAAQEFLQYLVKESSPTGNS